MACFITDNHTVFHSHSASVSSVILLKKKKEGNTEMLYNRAKNSVALHMSCSPERIFEDEWYRFVSGVIPLDL